MKLYKLLIPIVLLPAISIDGYEQNSKEEQIRKMEQLQVRGILDQDSTIIQRINANESVVNAPNNAVVDKKMAMKALRLGYIHYSSYEQQIDTIKVIEDIGIVMGLEIMKPIGLTANAGKTVKRRFTDIWMYRNKQWQIIARQATNISIE